MCPKRAYIINYKGYYRKSYREYWSQTTQTDIAKCTLKQYSYSLPWEKAVNPLQPGVDIPRAFHEVQDERGNHESQTGDEVDEQDHILS